MHTRSKSRSCNLCCCRSMSPTQSRVMLIFFPPAQAHRAAGGWAPPFHHCSWSPWIWGDLTHQHEQRGGSGTQISSLASLPASVSLTAFISPHFLLSQLLGMQSKAGAARQGSEGICLPAWAGGHPARTAHASPKSAPDCRCKVMHPLFSCFQIVFSYFQYLCFPHLPSLTVL